ncbi:MFS transporter [Nocardia sp. NBC_00565]|uniref:MFS transporter n=1 Tax=Nocardia sp. NBC_00565 TaxID=2975993 RepID=UPI002E806252|nr:MFS transporter [Nocardia sp. NBC_00565]WUC03843.1 MFS transporter [Nocardia sp. NBC_00565]
MRLSTGTPGFDRKLIAPMILGSILNPINSSMLAVALVPIGKAFGAPPSETIWLVSALYLATAVGQPVVGRLVDRFGPRVLYLIGTGLVGVAGVLGALAPGLGVLVLSRVLLGFGTSAAYPASMFLLRSESERTGLQSPAGVLAMLSIVNQVMVVVGPTLGGALIGVGGWHLIFTINVPLSLACLVLGRMSLPKLAALPAAVRAGQVGGVDIAGMVLFAGALVSSMLFLMKPAVAHWYLLVIAGVVGLLFVLRELRAAAPFIDLRVLGGNAPLLATYGRQVLAFVTVYAFLYGFTQWLEEGRSLSASVAGLVLLPMSLSAIAITAITGRRSQVRGKLIAGALLQVAACSCLLLLGPHTGIWLLVALGALVGLPQGLNGLANQNALYHQADPARMASSAGLLRTGTYLGALIAAAANAAVFPYAADSAGVHELAVLLLVVSVLLVIVTLADRSLARVGRDAV